MKTIVSKLDGTTIVAGSAFPVDDWLWGYERGLLDDGPLDLLITEVMDIEASKNLLLNELKLRSSSEILRQLETPPVLIASVANWTAIRWLRLVTDRVFRWEIRGQNRTTA